MIKAFPQLVYKQLVRHIAYQKNKASSNFYAKIYGSLRKAILLFYDPIITVKIGDNHLNMKLSHNLPLNMANFPFYDAALSRICSFLKQNFGYLRLIDVGANIGDTVFLVSQNVRGKFLCIEGDDDFFKLLKDNVSSMQNVEEVICLNLLCGEQDDESNLYFVRDGGTAHLSNEGDNSNKINTSIKKLDHIVKDYPEFERCNVIKIDTDGYDYKVIRGSERLLLKAHPALFFEFAPKLLLNAGEDLISIFDYLSKLGYRTALFYDWTRIPIIKINSSEIEYICQIINYARNKGAIFDLLFFHNSMMTDFDIFYAKEMEFFNNLHLSHP